MKNAEFLQPRKFDFHVVAVMSASKCLLFYFIKVNFTLILLFGLVCNI